MTNSQQVELDGKKLNPRELTFAEIEKVLESLATEEIHPLETICPEEPVPALAVALSTDLKLSDLINLTPSTATQLIKEVKESNPFLCQAVENLGAIAIEAQKKSSQTSEDQPAD